MNKFPVKHLTLDPSTLDTPYSRSISVQSFQTAVTSPLSLPPISEDITRTMPLPTARSYKQEMALRLDRAKKNISQLNHQDKQYLKQANQEHFMIMQALQNKYIQNVQESQRVYQRTQLEQCLAIKLQAVQNTREQHKHIHSLRLNRQEDQKRRIQVKHQQEVELLSEELTKRGQSLEQLIKCKAQQVKSEKALGTIKIHLYEQERLDRIARFKRFQARVTAYHNANLTSKAESLYFEQKMLSQEVENSSIQNDDLQRREDEIKQIINLTRIIAAKEIKPNKQFQKSSKLLLTNDTRRSNQ